MDGITIEIIPTTSATQCGKLADAEVHFTAGPLAGLKLVGFGIWQSARAHTPRVTFPARRYTANGDQRSFALLRPSGDAAPQHRFRDLLLNAHADSVQKVGEQH